MVARRLLSLSAWAVVLFLLWLVLVGTVAPLELLAGAIAAVIGAAVAELVRAHALQGYTLDPRWLGVFVRPLARVVPDFVLVMVALARTLATREAPNGRYVVVSLRDEGTKRRAAGWRALAGAAGSIAPNSVVVTVEREPGRMLVHELVPGRSPAKPL